MGKGHSVSRMPELELNRPRERSCAGLPAGIAKRLHGNSGFACRRGIFAEKTGIKMLLSCAHLLDGGPGFRRGSRQNPMVNGKERKLEAV